MPRASERQRYSPLLGAGHAYEWTKAPWNPDAAHSVAQHPALPYGVGLRVFGDKRLLRQIRDEIYAHVMPIATIAMLENVSSDQLMRLLEAEESAEGASAALRRLTDHQSGYGTVAWRTSRKRLSKRHIVNKHGRTLCGTPIGKEHEVLDSGPCHTCAARAGINIESPLRIRHSTNQRWSLVEPSGPNNAPGTHQKATKVPFQKHTQPVECSQ